MADLTHVLSDHLMNLFTYNITAFHLSPDDRSNIPVPSPPSLFLTTDLVTESEHIAHALAEAYLNPSEFVILPYHSFPEPKHSEVTLPWDAVRYSDRLTSRETGQHEEREKQHAVAYPPIGDMEPNKISRPTVVVDMHGVILAWYLPGVLGNARQVRWYCDCSLTT